jgi:hypothetical protein
MLLRFDTPDHALLTLPPAEMAGSCARPLARG